MFMFYYREPTDARPRMTPAPTMQPGFPTRAYLAERYAKRTGADISNLSSWVALAHFKSAAIAQGIAARVAAGSMAGQKLAFAKTKAERLAAGDPRPSLEERYADHAAYVSAVTRAAQELKSQRLLLDEDVAATIAAAQAARLP
jgi:hypothetical protein